MQTQIKICGLTREADIETALAHGADYLGFIVECSSSRRISLRRAAQISRPAKGLARCVAVTVDPNDALIDKIKTQMRPDILQLHGNESPKRVAQIKKETGLAVIKAVSIRERGDLIRAKEYEGIADFILLDAKPPRHSDQRGGHGLSFNWDLLIGFSCTTPLILAGGLDAANILKAKTTGLNFFDVSSGVEAKAGVKDPSLIAKFMKAARP